MKLGQQARDRFGGVGAAPCTPHCRAIRRSSDQLHKHPPVEIRPLRIEKPTEGIAV
jgi:hypothetical protein